MPRRWQVIRVELLHGRDIVCDPAPGRVLVCPPGTTFEGLGEAIDHAFARWDLAHLRQFVLPDGTEVVDEETAADLTASAWSPTIPRTAPLTERVSRRVRTGDRFTYVFDLGDAWTHDCTVEATTDPEEALGTVPDVPLPSWGWGDIPDQYGRRWADDDGESEPPPPRAPSAPAPPRAEPVPPALDVTALRVAVDAASAADLVTAVTGVDLTPALQQVGAGLLAVHRSSTPSGRRTLEPVMLSVLQRLEERAWAGDALLAADLLATVRGEPLEGTPLPVSLDGLIAVGHLSGDEEGGVYVNLGTGEVAPSSATDPGMVGEDFAIDPDDGSWVFVEGPTGVEWPDMEAFTASVRDPETRAVLAEAISGRGAFSRFRRAVEERGLREAWLCFADDRRWGRARELLDEHGIRPVGF